MYYSIDDSDNLSNGKNILELDNILIWELSSDSFRTYMVSAQGFSKGNKRLMVTSGAREETIISEHIRKGNAVRCCSAATKMSISEQDDYNAALTSEDYEACLHNLYSLESDLNSTYGYTIKGKSYRKK